jgi:hypothetical protein
MSRNFVAFDIETAKVDLPEFSDWRQHRPLGITCIASQTTACDEPRIWFTKTPSGTPAARMAAKDIAAFVSYLDAQKAADFLPLTWNGLGFDFDVLAEESGRKSACRDLALGHVDMMFHVFCIKGFPVALSKVASGMGLPGKTQGMSGREAPSRWAAGDHQSVIEYVCQDVRTTLAVASAAERGKGMSWITGQGKRAWMPLPAGWMTVDVARTQTLPDTSWMSEPKPRSSYTAWLDG